MKVTPHRLNALAGGRIVLRLPFRDDVVAGPNLQQLPEDQGPALRGRLFQGEDFHVAVVNAKVSGIALKRGVREIVIHVRVVLQPRMFDLHGREVQQPLQDDKRFLLFANLHLHEITELKNQAANLVQEQPVLFLNRTADEDRLFPGAEEPFQFLDSLLRVRRESLYASAQLGVMLGSLVQDHVVNPQRVQFAGLLLEVFNALIHSLFYDRVFITNMRNRFAA